MATWSDLQQVDVIDREQSNARNVAEGANNASIIVVNDQGSQLLLVTTVASLALPSTVSLRFIDLDFKNKTKFFDSITFSTSDHK